MASVKKFNFTLVFFKTACRADPGAERRFTGSSLYILRHIILKLLNTSANNNLFECTNHDILNFSQSSVYL